jgi:hypothetical protein
MKAIAWLSALTLAGLAPAGCGGGPDPILRNVPQPNKAVVAGAAAAVAGAATLASPADAAKLQEKNRAPDEKKPVKVRQTVPADVLDRLDARQQAGRAEAGSAGEDAAAGDRQPDPARDDAAPTAPAPAAPAPTAPAPTALPAPRPPAPAPAPRR